MLELTVTIKRGLAIVGAIGPLVRGRGAEQVTEIVRWLIECGERRIVLHTAGVTAVDLAGVVAVMDSHVDAKDAGGSLVIAAPSPALHTALRRTGLDQALDITDA
ncbi:MAG: STAS domain-containing protein [Cyanobacteria bacterium]|nr:STAS domain-containing protein [Cyanobacteriota bacterium]